LKTAKTRRRQTLEAIIQGVVGLAFPPAGQSGEEKVSGPFSAFSFRSFGRPAPRPERALQTQAFSHPFRPPLQTERLPAPHAPSQCLHFGLALRTVDLLEPGRRARPAARGSAAMERGFRLADGATNCTNVRLQRGAPSPPASRSAPRSGRHEGNACQAVKGPDTFSDTASCTDWPSLRVLRSSAEPAGSAGRRDPSG